MAITKFLARDLTIEVRDPASSGSEPAWVHIGGLNTLQHSPSTEHAETTDFDSGGRPTHIVAQRGDEWTLSGHALEDVATGDQDPGQVIVEEIARAIGLTAMGTFRLTTPGGRTETFEASAEFTKPGGGHNDPATWAVKLTVSGAPVIA